MKHFVRQQSFANYSALRIILVSDQVVHKQEEQDKIPNEGRTNLVLVRQTLTTFNVLTSSNHFGAWDSHISRNV